MPAPLVAVVAGPQRAVSSAPSAAASLALCSARLLPCSQHLESIGTDQTSMKGATVPDNRSGMGVGSNGRPHSGFHRVGLLLLPNRLPQPINPALLKHTQERAENVQN